MCPMRIDPEPWRKLSEALDGHLTARARRLLASEFVLMDSEGAQIGRLEMHGPEGADLRAGNAEARIERAGRSSYRMLSSGAQILAATGHATSPEITSQNHPYAAKLSILRNTAEAGQAESNPTIRIKGGLTNRNYEASFEPGEEGSLLVALFLLYRLVSLRREAYRTTVQQFSRSAFQQKQ
jgi:hypothetical protein